MYTLTANGSIYPNLYYFYYYFYHYTFIIDGTMRLFLKFNLFFQGRRWTARPPSLLPELTESLRFCFFLSLIRK